MARGTFENTEGIAELIVSISPEWAPELTVSGTAQIVISAWPVAIPVQRNIGILIPQTPYSESQDTPCLSATPKGRIVSCDSAALPLASQSVDEILVLGCIDEVPEKQAFLSELGRIATARGYVTLVFFQKTGLWPVSAGAFTSDKRRPSRSQVSRWLRHAGFDIARIVTSRYVRLNPDRVSEGGAAFKLVPVRSHLGALLGGVVVIRAKKQRYAPVMRPSSVWQRNRRQMKFVRSGSLGIGMTANRFTHVTNIRVDKSGI